MAKEGDISSAQDQNLAGREIPKETSKDESKTGQQAKPGRRTKRRKVEKKLLGLTFAQWVRLIGILTPIIGGIITIIVTIINSQTIMGWLLQPSLTAIPTAIATSSPMLPITDTVIYTFSATPTFTVVPSTTTSPTSTETPIGSVPTEPSPSPTMFVIVKPDKNTGRAPLTVTFDARDSYLLTPDGQKHSCRTGACHYIWRVYSNGQQLGDSDNDSRGTFQYIFRTRRQYTVTVNICWGKERDYCDSNGILIEVQ